MCKVYERKYVEYEVRIILLDGSFKNAKCEGINKSNYKEMIEAYNNVRDNYSLKNVDKLEFIGIDKFGQTNLIFTKDINIPDENVNKYQGMNSRDLLEEMIDIVAAIRMKNSSDINKLKATLDKKQDIILHQIETFDKANFDDDVSITEKIRLFDQLKQVRNERRELKNDVDILETIKNKIDLKVLNDKASGIIQRLNHKNEKFKFLSDELIEELHMMKEVIYKNNKQRINYMKQLQNKYDKIVNDEAHKKLICYNKAC